jgi:hypothetical protein
VQRRRRKKAAPKNVFGSVPQSTQKSKNTKSTKPNPPRGRAQFAPPPSVPGAKPKPIVRPVETIIEEVIEPVVEVVEETPTAVVEDEIPDEAISENEILEEQLPGVNGKEDNATNKETNQVLLEDSTVEDSGKSLRARQIIQDSMLKASLAAAEAKTQKATQEKPPVSREAPKKPQRKFRNRNSSYQAANRARRLDRSRHMEYKYEMRGLLVDIGIAEEHRSNILATIWARGERQTTQEAKDFLDEKLSEGIIDEEQMSSLQKIVDGYTVRR